MFVSIRRALAVRLAQYVLHLPDQPYAPRRIFVLWDAVSFFYGG